MEKILKHKKLISYGFLFIIALIVMIPMFFANADITRDDGIQHICRLIGTASSITEGQFFPNIMSNFCNGFGYSWNIFYSPITAYFPLVFQIFTSSYALMLKLFIFICLVASGIAMFAFTFEVTKSYKISLIASVVYMLSPYHLTDVYIRVAVAELASFVFLPLVFLGLYNLLEKDGKKSYYIAIGAIGLILSHTVITLITAILSFVYVIVHYKKLKEKKIWLILGISVFLILFVTAFFTLPLLEHKMATSYEVFVPGRMEWTDKLIYNKLEFYRLFYTPQGEIPCDIGIVTVIGLILSAIVIKKLPKEKKKTYLSFLTMGLVLLLMTLTIFPFEHLPSMIKMLQFPWRLLEFTSFFFSFVVAINVMYLIKNMKKADIIVITILALLCTYPIFSNLRYNENYDESKYIPAVRVTEQTGRVHAGMASFEYLPSKAFEHLDYIKQRENKTIQLEGDIKINKEQKQGTSLEIEFQNSKEGTILELPYIYYLGYQIELTTKFSSDSHGRTKLEYTESENGMIQITMPEVSKGLIKVSYIGSNGMKTGLILSTIGIILLVSFVIYIKKTKG